MPPPDREAAYECLRCAFEVVSGLTDVGAETWGTEFSMHRCWCEVDFCRMVRSASELSSEAEAEAENLRQALENDITAGLKTLEGQLAKDATLGADGAAVPAAVGESPPPPPPSSGGAASG